MEMKSLVPSLSYGQDMKVYMQESLSTVLKTADQGDYELSSKLACEYMTNMLEQQCTIMEHQLERMAVLRKLGKGEEAELALYNTMYENEEHMSGAQGESERAVDAAAAAGAACVLTALSAKERAQKALPRAPKAARPGTRFPAAPPHKSSVLGRPL